MSIQILEVQALRKMRQGLLYFIIVELLWIMILLIFAIARGMIANIAIPVVIIMMIVDVTLTVLGYLKLRDGFSILSSIGKPVGIGSVGAIIILIGTILVFNILLITLGGFLIIVIAGILLTIGYALLGIGLYKVGSEYNNTLTKDGGILTIIPFISFIGIVLSFIGIGEIIKKLPWSQIQFPYQPISQPTLVYPVGAATLRGGVAMITIHSNKPISIFSAKLLGTQYVTYNITPSYLSVGANTVVINFGNIALAEGVYTIRLTLSNGQYIDIQAYAYKTT